MTGISELVLHTNNEGIKYNYKYSKYDSSIAGEFITQKFDKSGNYCVITRCGDIVDNIYLSLITSEYISDPYKLIENVQLISQGEVVEEFSSDSMYISSIINKTQIVFQNENKIYLKLNFALKEIPLIRNGFYEIKVYVKLNELYKNLVLSKHLNVNYLFLHHLDRKELAQRKICEYQVSSIQEIKYNFKQGEQIKLDLPKGLLRELIIYVKLKQQCCGIPDILSTIKLKINSEVKENIDVMYYQHVTSRQYYNCETPNNMYIIPIDNTPLERYPSATLNTYSGYLSVILDIKENINIEDYEIILFSRNCETIVSAHSMLYKIKQEIKQQTKQEKQEIKQERTLLNYITFGYY